MMSAMLGPLSHLRGAPVIADPVAPDQNHPVGAPRRRDRGLIQGHRACEALLQHNGLLTQCSLTKTAPCRNGSQLHSRSMSPYRACKPVPAKAGSALATIDPANLFNQALLAIACHNSITSVESSLFAPPHQRHPVARGYSHHPRSNPAPAADAHPVREYAGLPVSHVAAHLPW